MLQVHGGDILRVAAEVGVNPDEILDFSSNVNTCAIPEAVVQALQNVATGVSRYPDSTCRQLRASAAKSFGVSVECVLAGNGSTEFIYAIPRRLRPRRVLILAPCYHDYWRAADQARAEAEGVLASESEEFAPSLEQLEQRLSGVDMVFIGNPNNPTGVALAAEQLRTTVAKFPNTIFVIDEALIDFVPESQGASMLSAPLPENVIVLRSLSLFYGLAGLRLGFMVASADLCESIERVREPWTVGPLAQAAGRALLDNPIDFAGIRGEVLAERERVRDELSRMTGLRVFRSQANFLLLKVTKPTVSPAQICERLLKQKVLIRNTAGFRGLDGKFVRVSIRSAADNDKLLDAMRIAVDESKWK